MTERTALSADVRRLPWAALLALTTAAFLTVLTEALPAGVLPGMSAGLGVTESAAGQTVTIYALGTALSAIPLSAATAGWRRKRLLVAGTAGFAVANTVTAVSPDYVVTMAGRFVAGVAAGVVWAMLAGYARRMAPEGQQGRAIAVVMAGIPVALALGVPVGTFVGAALGWRAAFGIMSVLAVVLLVWIALRVPDFPGQGRGDRIALTSTMRIPGVAPILFVTLVFILAHTILYTYVAAYLRFAGMAGSTGAVLLVFGIASIVSIGIVGARIDRHLRALLVTGSLLVSGTAAVLAVFAGSPVPMYLAVALWGLGWGGVPTLLQTAIGVAGGRAADVAQSILVTLWNVAMAGGGIVGGILLAGPGAGSLPWSVLLLMVPVVIVVVGARTHGFPAAPSARSPGERTT